MAIQGMALAIRLREQFPGVIIVETHPKVLYHALSGDKYVWPENLITWLAEKINCDAQITTEHEWDAAISAWTALQGLKGVWVNDLRCLSTPTVEPAGPVHYWWPE